jgi:hypothetical protein
MAAPKYLAPHGTCPRCGWRGNDWAFRYQGLCTKCYRAWRRQRAQIFRSLRPKNENISLTPDLVVTRNVRKRLLQQAEARVPVTARQRTADRVSGLAFIILWGGIISYNVFNLDLGVPGGHLLIAWFALTLAVVAAAERISAREAAARRPAVDQQLMVLAEERRRRIAEAEAFYASPEWKLVREEVVREQGRQCRACGKTIVNDAELTVDHILPRSRRPDLALVKTNLRVLCRSCNASKGDRLDE